MPAPDRAIRAALVVDRLAAHRRRVRLLVFAATAAGVIPWLLYLGWSQTALDAHAYFAAQPGNLYGAAVGAPDAYLYSPAFSQVVEPLRWLGWDGFRSAIRLADLGAIALLAGPFTGLLIFAQPASLEFNMGNIHPLLGLAIVAGFRWPAAWAFVLLTKVTPGIGLLWFVVRREWRKAAVSLTATAAIVIVSFVISPGDWFGWFRSLAGETAQPGSFSLTSLPLPFRLVGAAALVVWGARTNRRWTVLIAAFLALPAIWQHSLTMLVGLWALRTTRREPIGVMVRAQ